MKGAEAEMKRKEVKGNARKGNAKEAKQSSQREFKEKEIQEREGQGAQWPAVARQRVNPATGRDRARRAYLQV